MVLAEPPLSRTGRPPVVAFGVGTGGQLGAVVHTRGPLAYVDEARSEEHVYAVTTIPCGGQEVHVEISQHPGWISHGFLGFGHLPENLITFLITASLAFGHPRSAWKAQGNQCEPCLVSLSPKPPAAPARGPPGASCAAWVGKEEGLLPPFCVVPFSPV